VKSSQKVYWKSLFFLAGIKLFIHFAANYFTEFGLQRDEYLYLNESEHLAWGYMEVPPMISFIGWISKGIFGQTLLAVKLPTALLGASTVLLLGIFIRDLGGKKWAQIIGATAFVFSPAFLGSNHLFQPVSFNQFFWFLSALLVVKIVNKSKQNQNSFQIWILLGIIAGLGFLTKYSIVFFYAGLVGAVLLTPYRALLKTKHPYIALLIAVLISSPNLWWQYSHDFPIVRHMEDLRATQLVNVTWQSFLSSQLQSHLFSAIVWIPGLIFGLGTSDKRYRLLSFSFIFLVALIFLGSGKGYYTFGAFTLLFGLGGIMWERVLKNKAWIIPPLIALLNIPIFPMALPILPTDEMVSYSSYLQNSFGLIEPFRWEDGQVRGIRQDYADMLGWEEIPVKVAEIYNSLSEDEKEHCLIWGGHYGHAGVLNFRRGRYNLPECHSFNASYVAWVPGDFHIKAQIQVEDSKMGPSPFFEETVLMDSIENPLARDPGYIYLNRYPKMDLRENWKKLVEEERKAAGY